MTFAVEILPLLAEIKIFNRKGRKERKEIQDRNQEPDDSLAVRHPNILYLGRMLQEPAAFALLHIEPVNGAAFVGENLFKIPNRVSLGGNGAGFIRETPDSVNVVVLGESLQQLGCVAGDDVDCSAREIAGVEKLVQISSD